MEPITITLGPSPPRPPCRHCGEPAAVEVRGATHKRPGKPDRELLRVFPLYLCRPCSIRTENNLAPYLRHVAPCPGATLDILVVSLDMVVRSAGNP